MHYPVIKTVPVDSLNESVLSQAKQCTHWVFTSPNAVKHWFALSPLCLEDKAVFAVGPATAAFLLQKSIQAQQPQNATQEGMIELLETLSLDGAYIGWPRSSLARPLLSNYLERRKIRYVAIELYRTISQRLEPVPDLAQFEEIVFTSPSTVRAFLEIFGSIPPGKKMTAIGPVTREVLERLIS